MALRNFKYMTILAAAVMTLASCKSFVNPFAGSNQGDMLAKVGDTELYVSDVQSIFTPGMLPEDSLKLLNSVVDTWVKKQLKIFLADALSSDSHDEIDKMVDEYRNSLMIYKYEQEFIEKNVDTTVTQQQMSEYYNSSASEFVLYSPMIKGRIVRFPSDYRQANKLRELMKSAKESDKLDLLDIADKNNFNIEEFSAWTEINNVIGYLPPLSKDADMNALLKENTTHESTDKQYRYILRVEAVKQSGDRRPMEQVADMIKMMIINKRKQDALKQMEDSLYRVGLQNKDIIINTKQEETEVSK